MVKAGARLDVLVFADLPLDPRLVAFATGPRYAPLQVGLIWPHFALSTSLSNVDYYLLPGDLALRDGDATKHGDRFGEQLVFLDGVGHSILSDPPGVDVLKPPSRSRHARPGPFFDAPSGARDRARTRATRDGVVRDRRDGWMIRGRSLRGDEGGRRLRVGPPLPRARARLRAGASGL